MFEIPKSRPEESHNISVVPDGNMREVESSAVPVEELKKFAKAFVLAHYDSYNNIVTVPAEKLGQMILDAFKEQKNKDRKDE